MDQASIYQPGMHILLIEDDPMIGQSLMRTLEDAGMSGDWIRDGDRGKS